MDDPDVEGIMNALNFVSGDISLHLWRRGWGAPDPNAEPLVFVWPPTAGEPWTAPTTIAHDGDVWIVSLGRTAALDAPEPMSLQTTEIGRAVPEIEAWPLSEAEMFELADERVLTTLKNDAYDQFSQGFFPTEPYAGWMSELAAHARADDEDRRAFLSGRSHRAERLATERPHGDLEARRRLLDGQAWASYIRNDRAARGERGRTPFA